MTRTASLTRTRTLVAALLGVLLAASCVAAASLEAKPKKKKGNGAPLTEVFDVRPTAGGFERAITFDYLPGGRMLVGEKVGRLWLVQPNGSKRLVLDLSSRVVNERERGLEGIEVASDFATSRRVYLIYAFKVNPSNPSGRQALRLTYIRLGSSYNLLNPSSPETVVLGKEATSPCKAVSNKRDCPASISAVHQGGTVLSDPDGTLWVGFGDSNLPESPGNQVFRTFNPKSTAGKILHIDSEGNGLKKHPFCKKTKKLDRTCTKVHAVGFRNPFRFVLTPSGRPIVADVGWNAREEINLVKKGRNYGWPCKEGSLRTAFYREKKRCQKLYGKKKALAGPIYSYPNNNKLGGAAAIMGPQHQSPSYPRGLRGAYFFGDYASRFIKEGVLRKGKLKGIRTVATNVFPVQFRVAPNGNIAFVDFAMGTINELVYAPNKAPTARASASPRAFCANSGNVSFSSRGSSDREGDPLTYRWDFESDGTTDSTAANPTHFYAVPGTKTATLRVSDGNATDSATVTIYVGDCPPSATVHSPRSGSQFTIGSPVSLRASGTDPDDGGTLGNSRFKWDVVLIHKGHAHDLGTFTGRSARFNPVADHDADSYYQVTLSVTDPGGLTVVKGPLRVSPETVRLRLKTNIGKVKLSYGGRNVKAPEKFRAAIGFEANLSAPKRVRKKGRTFRFKRWSIGGRRSQVFTIPGNKKTVTAKYKPGG